MELWSSGAVNGKRKETASLDREKDMSLTKPRGEMKQKKKASESEKEREWASKRATAKATSSSTVILWHTVAVIKTATA